MSNEHRLLRLRARDAAALITAAVPNIQTPLASAAELADAIGPRRSRLRRLVAPSLGPKKQFVSISLWRLGSLRRGPVAVVGVRPALAAHRALAARFLAGARRRNHLAVIGMLSGPRPGLGYAIATPGLRRGYVAYGEGLLPPDRRSALASSSQFAGLDYVLYLGRLEQPADLLVTDVRRPPLAGGTAIVTIPFGDNAITLLMAARVPLAGALPRDLPWITAVVGGLLSLAAGGVVFALVRRRRQAELRAGNLAVSVSEAERLYNEQRKIAQTLQHALLPERLPRVPGIKSSAVFEAGEHGVDVGGDWYDVIDLGRGRLLMVVGDVSGRGLRAATTMAALRFAIQAYAAAGEPPTTILSRLNDLVRVSESGQLATVLCASVDVDAREVCLASAGHLPPLLLTGGGGRYLDSQVGLPVGVDTGAIYTSTTVSVPAGATLVAFTDGLVEQRGESIDDGLARLRETAAGRHEQLPELLRALLREGRAGYDDDVAILGLRWVS